MLRCPFTIRQDRYPGQEKLGAQVSLAKTFLGHTVSTTMKSVLATVSTTAKFALLKKLSRAKVIWSFVKQHHSQSGRRQVRKLSEANINSSLCPFSGGCPAGWSITTWSSAHTFWWINGNILGFESFDPIFEEISRIWLICQNVAYLTPLPLERGPPSP